MAKRKVVKTQSGATTAQPVAPVKQPRFWDTDFGKAIKGAALAAVAAGGYSLVVSLQANASFADLLADWGIPTALVYGALNFVAKRLDPNTPNVETVVGNQQ